MTSVNTEAMISFMSLVTNRNRNEPTEVTWMLKVIKKKYTCHLHILINQFVYTIETSYSTRRFAMVVVSVPISRPDYRDVRGSHSASGL